MPGGGAAGDGVRGRWGDHGAPTGRPRAGPVRARAVHPRAAELIRTLRLEPHPEGGRFVETFRSSRVVRPAGGARDRTALTSIHFLLVAGEASRWHRLDADEVWHHYEGGPLELLLLDPAAAILTRTRLGPVAPGSAPTSAVPAGSWMAARPLGAYALVGCTMGPGFAPEGFLLMHDVPDVAAAVARRFPEVAELL
jgi:predicted cupin superfamily sugar epimerase